ncbi:MAG: hypothetical protein BGN95_03820 [Sphingomonas sp. 66-10]|uniref:phage tail length tape measure family protein n=1 Tax=Sphingomonas sp. 66-10 TaxID=1895848 RepID=UPI000929BAE9|nr:phage tail length tape measure family protein [Sphingomonas sp. 66-10]OJU22705.1 MAG: hypothetical protein BGN95_03820 [Sphingomonas sp. 66-10]
MSNFDIIARLQLSADQFSSETGKRFAEMKARAASAADEVKKPFVAAFADVQRQAAQALNLPRTSSGSLDLSQEIASLRESATAADQRALALRELANAQLSVANAGHADAAALRLEADAAMVAAHAAEAAAQADRDRIGAIGAVQAELNRTTSATVAHSQALNRNTVSAGQQRMAMQQLGFQINDVATQYSAGSPPMQIFAQQTGQVVQALGLMTNSTKGVLGFLGGPWGAVLTAATVIAVPFIAKLIDGSAAAEEMAKRLADAANAADSFGAAQTLLGKVIDLQTGKMKTQNEVLKEAIRLQATAGVIKAREDQKAAGKEVRSLGEAGILDSIVGGFSGLGGAYNPRMQAIGVRFAAGSIDIKQAREEVEKLGLSAKQTNEALLKLVKFGTARNDEKANQEVIDALDGKGISPDLVPYQREKKKREKKPRDLTSMSQSAAEEIARINAQWDEQPKLIDKARVETLRLDNLIKDLGKKKPPNFEKLIEDAQKAKQTIQDGLDRPFRDFVRTQNESVAVNRFILQGHDDQAAALREAFRLKESMEPLDQKQLATLTSIARQNRVINDALEDQRRIVGLYVGAVGGLQRTFDQFLSTLYTSPVDAVKGIVSGTFNTLKQLRNDLLSNALFGGIDREVERYIRKLTGRQTPAEILQEQAGDAGQILGKTVADVDAALNRLVASVNKAANGVAANDNIKPGAAPEVGQGVSDGDASQTGDVVVTAKRKIDGLGGAIGIMLDGLNKNLKNNFGFEIPKVLVGGLKQFLPEIVRGGPLGQLSGSVFSAITGGRNDPTASAIGGAIGKIGGDALGKAVGGLLGKVGGPLGSIVGGVLGNLVGGLFRSIKWGSASVDLVNGKAVGGSATGKGADEKRSATGSASGLAKGINQVVDALGAQISSLPGITIGSWDGKARVALTKTSQALHYNNFNDSVLKDFGKDGQQAALEYAIAYSVSHAVLTGISQASKNIIAKGSDDIEGAIQKALLIEAIPRDLKAMVDPVGAAIDELNRKWAKTKAALDEGGASTEQMAQAQRLYQMQLDQIKASTASASATLKEFLTTLNIGSNSPLSLRDQEAAAMQQLKPFLTAIEAGQTIDQSKYQAAAQSYLDIERQLYGSTSKFFEAFDAVQAATNKAIASIDNAAPVSDPVANPFAKATADSTAAAASGIKAGNELLSQNSDLLQRIASAVEQLTRNGGSGGGFIGANRNFVSYA